jgi:hypothetical protein
VKQKDIQHKWKKEKRPCSLKNSFDSSKQKVYTEITGEGATCTLFYTAKKIPMGRAMATHKQPQARSETRKQNLLAEVLYLDVGSNHNHR